MMMMMITRLVLKHKLDNAKNAWFDFQKLDAVVVVVFHKIAGGRWNPLWKSQALFWKSNHPLPTLERETLGDLQVSIHYAFWNACLLLAFLAHSLCSSHAINLFFLYLYIFRLTTLNIFSCPSWLDPRRPRLLQAHTTPTQSSDPRLFISNLWPFSFSFFSFSLSKSTEERKTWILFSNCR